MKKLFLILTLLASYASIYAEKIIPVYIIAITQEGSITSHMLGNPFPWN